MLMLVSHFYLQAGYCIPQCECFSIKLLPSLFDIQLEQASKQVSWLRTRKCADMASINQTAFPGLVQVRVESVGGLGVVVTGVNDILWVPVSMVVLLGTLDVLLALTNEARAAA